jgi:integrase
VLDRIIGANPCDPIELPEAMKQEVEALPVEVVEALIAGMTRRYRALLRLAAGTGLRQGEPFALEVDHFDFLRRTVRVQQQLIHSDHGGEPYIGQLKTKQSYRTVPVAAFLVEEVAAFLASFPAREVEIWDRTDPRKPVLRKARLIFTNTRDRAIRRGAWSKVWAVAVQHANESFAAEAKRRGAPTALAVPEWASMHSLRHFYASLLIRAGENVKTVQRRLGHAQPSITLNTYAHLWPDAEDTSRAAVEAAFGRGSALDVPSPKLNSVKQQVRVVS